MPDQLNRVPPRRRASGRGGGKCALRLVAVSSVCMVITAPAQARDERAWDHASSIGRDALVIASLGIPAVHEDWTGSLQAAGSVAAASLASEGLKRVFPEERPDRSDDKSFPSGHTSASFAAAASLQNRYGWRAGLPAQLVAAFVGFSRIQARKHHWYDVVVGAGIGEASGFLITSKRSDRLRVTAWGDPQGAGAALAFRF